MARNRLQTVEVRIAGDVQDVLTKFQRVEIAGDKLGTKITARVAKPFRELGVAVAGAAGAFLSFEAAQTAARYIFGANEEAEKLQATLKTVTGSAKAGAAAFQLISDFAASTPFQIQNLTSAFIQLRARGFDPTRQDLAGLGNFAAAFNRDFTDLAAAVVSLSAGMVRPIREFGVDAHVAGDKVTLSFQGVTKTVARTAAAISSFLVQVGNTRFADAMAERMNTLEGALSNLKDSAFRVAVQIGENGLNGALEDVVHSLNDAISESDGFAKTLGGSLASGVRGAEAALEALLRHLQLIATAAEVLAGAAIGRGLAGLAVRFAGLAAAAGDAGAAILGLAGGPVGAVLALAGAVGGPLLLHLLTARSEAEKLGDALQTAASKAEKMGAGAIRSQLARLKAQLQDLVEQAERFHEALSAAPPGSGLAKNFQALLDRNREQAQKISASIQQLEEALRSATPPPASSAPQAPSGAPSAGGHALSGISTLSGRQRYLSAGLGPQDTSPSGQLERLAAGIEAGTVHLHAFSDAVKGAGDAGHGARPRFEALAFALSSSLSRALSDVVTGSASAGAALSNLAVQLFNAFESAAINKLVGGLFGIPLLGFATGGEFTVGGRGGTDSNLVAFRATRGEHVAITRPGAGPGAGAGRGHTFVVNVDARGATNPAEVHAAATRAVLAAAPSIVEAAKGRVVQQLRRPRMA